MEVIRIYSLTMKRLGVQIFSSSPPLDGMLVHHRVIPSITFADTQLYTWVGKGTVTVRCIAQEQNTMSSARAQAWTAQSGVEHTNHEATVPPQKIDIQYNPSLE